MLSSGGRAATSEPSRTRIAAAVCCSRLFGPADQLQVLVRLLREHQPRLIVIAHEPAAQVRPRGRPVARGERPSAEHEHHHSGPAGAPYPVAGPDLLARAVMRVRAHRRLPRPPWRSTLHQPERQDRVGSVERPVHTDPLHPGPAKGDNALYQPQSSNSTLSPCRCRGQLTVWRPLHSCLSSSRALAALRLPGERFRSAKPFSRIAAFCGSVRRTSSTISSNVMASLPMGTPWA